MLIDPLVFQYDDFLREMCSAVQYVHDVYKERFSTLSTQEVLHLKDSSAMPLLSKAIYSCRQSVARGTDLGSGLKMVNASMSDLKRYPCQCGKVFSRKDQSACPKRSGSQSLQLGLYMSGELSPKTRSTPSLPRLEAKLESGMGTSKT